MMRFDQVQLFSSGNMASGTLTSSGINLNQVFMGSVQAVWTGTGTPAGNFSIQVSDDIVATASGTNPAANVVNWVTYTGSSVAAGSAAGNNMWLFATTPFAWIRLIYVKTSGSGSVDAVLVTKG